MVGSTGLAGFGFDASACAGLSVLPAASVASVALAVGLRSKPSTVVCATVVAFACPGACTTAQYGQAVAGFSLNSSVPLRSRTLSMNQGVTRKPPLANAV